MGRKKGKQAGQFANKKTNLLHRYTLNDYASEADEYRNPVRTTFRAEDVGRWHRDGTGLGGRDKWSTLFSSKSSSSGSQSNAISHSQSAAVGRRMAHLRFLLEERRIEDRIDDRQLRLRLQRQRMRKLQFEEGYNNICTTNTTSNGERHEPGWLLTQDMHKHDKQDSDNSNNISSLQNLAAQRLGPLLPMYVAACGHEYVGNALQSVSSDVLCEISIALANSPPSEATITDGVIKSLVQSGGASRLVLKGTGTPVEDDFNRNEGNRCDDEDDTHLLSDVGLLAICPRIQSNHVGTTAPFNNDNVDDKSDSSCDNWETIAHDIATVGCIHLTRLELIDIPLSVASSTNSSLGGISINALRRVLKTCPGITHLSLSGCFRNCQQNTSLIEQAHDANMLIGGSFSSAITPQLFDQFRCDDGEIVSGLDDLLPDLRVLDLSFCNWLTTDALKLFLMKCKQRDNDVEGITTLQHVNIFGCDSLITPSFLHWIDERRSLGLLDGIVLSRQRQTREKYLS